MISLSHRLASAEQRLATNAQRIDALKKDGKNHHASLKTLSNRADNAHIRTVVQIPKQIDAPIDLSFVTYAVSFSFLSPNDLNSCASVCKQWNVMATNPRLYCEQYARMIARENLEIHAQYSENPSEMIRQHRMKNRESSVNNTTFSLLTSEIDTRTQAMILSTISCISLPLIPIAIL